MKTARLLAAATALASSFPASAQQVALGDRNVLEAATTLKNGQFLWAPELSAAGPALLVVNLETQRAVFFRNGVPIGATTISSGKEGYETPTGVFTILQKNKEHYSRTYDNAPMPNMQRLTWRGIALHAGNLPGYPASHGCIRLPAKFSSLLFGATELGMTAIKVASFGSAVNVTLGLPFPRTSPDHGTAIDIAGKGVADSSSMKAAIRLCSRIAASRVV